MTHQERLIVVTGATGKQGGALIRHLLKQGGWRLRAVTRHPESEAAQALAAQGDDRELAARFAPVAKALADREATIVAELLAAQGNPVDLGGYYLPDAAKTTAAMRPSATFNAVIDGMSAG